MHTFQKDKSYYIRYVFEARNIIRTAQVDQIEERKNLSVNRIRTQDLRIELTPR